MTDRRAPGTAPGMSFHVPVRVSLAVLVLASMLGGCDPKSTEVGATVADFGTPSGSDTGGGSTTTTDTGSGSVDCKDGVPLLSGTVHRELGDHSWNDAFEPTSGAFVHLYLVVLDPDGTGGTGIGEELVPFEGLPFDFALCIPEDSTFEFDDDEDYGLLVHVFNHDTTELWVGDLAPDGPHPVDAPTDGLQIVVSGVEHCDAPYADDLCSTVVDDSNEGSGG